MNVVSHGTEPRLCHERDVLVHCLAAGEDKHIYSNAANHWQQFLHQRHFSAILPVDFIDRFDQKRFL